MEVVDPNVLPQVIDALSGILLIYLMLIILYLVLLPVVNVLSIWLISKFMKFKENGFSTALIVFFLLLVLYFSLFFIVILTGVILPDLDIFYFLLLFLLLFLDVFLMIKVIQRFYHTNILKAFFAWLLLLGANIAFQVLIWMVSFLFLLFFSMVGIANLFS